MTTNYFIIDSLNLAYRQHNVNFELRTADGTPSGMVYGFVKSILSLKKKYRGYKFIAAWDNKAQWKFDLYPNYKTDRISLPSTVTPQIASIKEILACLGIDQYEKEGEEADDTIASFVENVKTDKETGVVIIYSNDKDLLQLVQTGKVIVYKPKVGVVPEKFYDEEAVKEQYGVSPDKLVYFRAFDGDSSDKIEGIPRVPRKIIANLVNSNDGFDEIYKSLETMELTEFRKSAFEGFKAQLEINDKIMRLKRDLTDLKGTFGIVSKEGLVALLNKYEIKSIDPDVLVDIFSSSINIKYSDARPAYRLESYSLFE